MTTHNLKYLIGSLILFLLAPLSTQAFYATSQHAVRLNEKTVLYTASFSLGYAKNELRVPIAATRAAVPKSYDSISYAIYNGETVVDWGVASGLLLTKDEDTTVENKRYVVPHNRSAEFTLLALLTVPEDLPGDMKLSLQVTDVPFTLTQDGITDQYRLDANELKDYRTPAVDFGGASGK